MGLRKSIRRMIDRHRIQKRINAARYVHLMFNDKFNKPFVDFLNRHFDPSEHLVLCKRWFSEHPFPTGPNVVEVATFRGLDFSVPTLRQVICHSVFDPEIVDLLYENRQWLEKSVWIVWGGDLYQAPRDEKNDYVRGHFHGHWAGVDFPLVRERYGAQGWNCRVAYQFPIRKEMLDRVVALRSSKAAHGGLIRVQVNNSCHESTIPVLKALARFRDRDLVVRTIVSYGNLQAKDEVLQVGRELFGSRFEVIDEFMSAEQYARWLDEIDILVLNQPRQQGVGNTMASMYLGKKIFIRSDVTTFGFNDMGARVYDSLAIPSISWEDFVNNPPEAKDRNFAFALKSLDEDSLAESYKKAFEMGVFAASQEAC